ncbi:MAG: hypothetical protein AB4290_18980 [Spirulina sp.]
MFFLMGWQQIQNRVRVAIANKFPQAMDLDIAENLRKIEQRYFLERRSLL